MDRTLVLVVLALVLSVLAGLLAAAEAGLHGFSRARARELAEAETPGARSLLAIAADPPRFLNTALLVRTVAEIGATVCVALAVFELFEQTWAKVLLTAGIMIVVSFIGWGVAPRTLGRQHAERVALASAGPVRLGAAVLGPVPQVLIVIGNALTPGKGFELGPFSTETELRELVDLAGERAVIETSEQRMLQSVFDLGDTVVREVMVPRPDVVSIEHTASLRSALSLALRSGFSRIPVVTPEQGLDDVIGVVFLKDVMKRVYERPQLQSSELVTAVMRSARYVPESLPVDVLLREMQATHSHLVLVVDEFGGTSGLATIEDILEEIVGDIADEYDTEAPAVVELGPERYRVSSRLPLDELGDLFDLEIDDDDVDSVGGLLAKELGTVPIAGSLAETHGLVIVADRPSGRRHSVATVLVTRADDDTGTDAAAGLATSASPSGSTALTVKDSR